MLRLVLRAQAVFYVLGGLWPLLHLDSFERVTGPKVDDWLVRTVGLLTAVIGGTLWAGAAAPVPSRAIVFLAAGTAASFAAIDIRYALIDRIRDIYLLDAAAELCLVVLVLVGALRTYAHRDP